MAHYDHLNQGAKPLLGVVLCCTSIPPEQRSDMARIAQQMGAIHKLDLTSDVTHLIVGNIDTPKYKYVAKERQDIRVLQPEWLEAVRAAWIQGEETDVAKLEEQYKLPTLSNLQICVTGFDDIAQRTDIQNTVTDNGANYHGDLTKAVTHLIAAAPSGKKYEYAGAWGIKIVTLEWLAESLERGMALDESLYHPTLAPESRGKGAVTQRKVPSPHLGKHPRAQTNTEEIAGVDRRKLRRTASTRLESQNDALWADIGSGDTKKDTEHGEGPEGDSFAADKGAGKKAAPVKSNEPVQDPRTLDASIFSENSRPVRIFINGFGDRQTNLLIRHLSSTGAELLSESAMRERVAEGGKGTNSSDIVKVVLPHDVTVDGINNLFDKGLASESDVLVNEWWLEKCMYRKSLVDHEEEPLCKPFDYFPISGFETLRICPTSFNGIDLLIFSRAVTLMGASYNETLSLETSVLVCYEASAHSGKLRFALENKIPIVSADWFYDSVRKGEKQPFEDYALSTPRQSQNSSQSCFFHPVNNPRPPKTSHSSFRGKKERPVVRPPQRRGCLDLTRHPRPEDPPDGQGNENSENQQDSIYYIPDVPTWPLQDLSPSKQNTQQNDSLNTPATDREEQSAHDVTSDATGKLKAPAAADKSKDNSLKDADKPQHAHPKEQPQQQSNDEQAASSAPEHTTSKAKAKDSSRSEDSHNSNNINTAIAALLAQQQKTSATSLQQSRRSSASSSHSSAHPSIHQAQQQQPKPRTRTLGRAPSNGAVALSRSNSRDSRRRPSTSEAFNDDNEEAVVDVADVEDDVFDVPRNRRAGAGGALETGGFRPSQALSYEDPEGKTLREQLLARLSRGGKYGAESDGGEAGEAGASFGLDGLDERGREKGQRVESIGVVRDVGGAAEEKKRRGMRRK